MHLPAAAAALLTFTLGVPALALHPTHPRELTRHGEAHRSLAHIASHHTGSAHAARHLAHDRRAAPHAHTSLAAGHRHGRQHPQPAHLLAATPHLQGPAQLSVVGIVRDTPASRPQLPDVAEAATEPLALPKMYDERGRLLVPAALVGSHEILLHQNTMADQDGLGRIQNDADLDAMRARGMLVALPAGPALNVDERLPLNRRVARPWTAQFLSDLSRDYARRFHAPLQLTSAVRTVEFQQKLMHHNGNAAPADGDTASPHLTGQAVDLGKRGMTIVEIAWMRGYLLPLIQSGKIDVEEEFRQSCFHISVYRRYAPPAADRYAVASRGTTSSLATLIP